MKLKSYQALPTVPCKFLLQLRKKAHRSTKYRHWCAPRWASAPYLHGLDCPGDPFELPHFKHRGFGKLRVDLSRHKTSAGRREAAAPPVKAQAWAPDLCSCWIWCSSLTGPEMRYMRCLIPEAMVCFSQQLSCQRPCQHAACILLVTTQRGSGFNSGAFHRGSETKAVSSLAVNRSL